MKLRRSLAACAVAGALVLSGCGDTDADKDAAATPTSGSTTSSTTGSGSGSDAPAKGPVDVAEFVEDLRDGAEESDSSHAKMTITTGGQTIVTEGDFAANDGDPVARMTMNIPGAGEMEIRLVDDAFYMNMGEMTGGKFTKMDIKDMPAEIGESLEAMDPDAQVEQYAAAIQSVEFVGEAEHGGVDAEQYKVTMDAAKLQGIPAGAKLPKTVVMDLFLDDENRLCGMTMDMKVQGQAVSMDGVFSDFGKKVEVTAPAKAELAAG